MSIAQKPLPVYRPRDHSWQPPALAPAYKSSVARSPRQAPVVMPTTISEASGPVFGHNLIGPLDDDLRQNFAAVGESAIGPRIVVHGQVRDQSGCGVPNTLIEVWQANAGGRYRHKNESYLAPLDPNFGGCGRCFTDSEGYYRFYSIQPGAYPWPNSENSWRPAHIHFSLFGQAFTQRLITQMYFAGDPLIEECSIVNAIPQRAGIDSLIAQLDLDATLPMDSLAWRFDITLRGRQQTCFEQPGGGRR
ncbi:MAG: protocatechuate 3,4-dioxygenase beta subunit [Planctomycetota bacterium]|jgi:protocatechuate 3,4-dioxygenase beta subunit